MKTAFILLLFALGPIASSAAQSTVAPDVRFEQRVGTQLPLDVMFTDTAKARRPLQEFFHGKPVVLYFGYARCPQLCSVVADGANEALRRLAPSVGRDFQVVTISIDPAESTADAKAAEALAVRRYGRTGAVEGWHYVTGSSEAIGAVAEAAGFHFRYDPISKQYAHPSGFLIATPDGRIARYFLGVDFAAAEVASALQRAAEGKTGRPIRDLLLLCFRGEKIGGRYGALIWRVLGVSVALTVLALGSSVGWMLWQERRASKANPGGSA